MDPILVTAIFSGALQIIASLKQSQGGQLTDAQLDELRKIGGDKLADFLKVAEGK